MKWRLTKHEIAAGVKLRDSIDDRAAKLARYFLPTELPGEPWNERAAFGRSWFRAGFRRGYRAAKRDVRASAGAEHGLKGGAP